jgi:hypothetical protein
VCREVAHQTVLGGISKELKAIQKKVWPSFPLQIGTFSLLDFGHLKVEAATLGEIKRVDIEFRKHDPYKIVGNHMASCNLKRYEHEESPQDEMFRGARSYQEVLNRVRALSPDKITEFYNFKKLEGIAVVSRLSVSEQVRGDIILKTWEANIAESKRTAKEVKQACEETLHSLDIESLGLRKDDHSEVLG